MTGTLIVSLDFELFWGVHSSKKLEEYRNNIAGGRRAIPTMLELFQKYGIHATWATVGMMFGDSRKEIAKFFPEDVKLPTYNKTELSSYDCLGRIDVDQKRDFLFAGELIKTISNANGQEVGSHTFSHYFCREAGQTIEQFDADLSAAESIAQDKGYQLTSMVLPRNQCEPEYIDILSRHGFTAYRDEENDWIHEKVKCRPLMRVLRLMDVYLPLTGQGGYIPKQENGIWNLTGSRMYKPFFKPLAFLEPLKIHRIKRQMLHAAKNGLVFHLWWHPHNVGVRTDYHLKQLERVFQYYEELKEKYGMRSLNMREMVAELER